MSLADGVYLIQTGVNATLSVPLDIINGLSFYDIILAGMVASLIGWFTARMIKGKAHNEIAVQSEFAWSAESGGFDAERAYADDFTGVQTTLERAGGWSEEGQYPSMDDIMD